MKDENGYLIPDKEPLMACNAFSLTKTVKGIEAVAHRMVNLLFQEKGTCFDCYDMGVGIKLYLYERASDAVLSQIQDEALRQINKYMTDVKVGSCEANYVTASDAKSAVGGLTLVMTFNFTEPIEGKTVLSVKFDKKKESSDVNIEFFVD